MARDQQRAKLYASEQRVRRDVDAKSYDGRPDKRVERGDLAAATAYANRAIERATEHADLFIGLSHDAPFPVDVFVHRPTAKATYYNGRRTIGLPDRSWAWRGLVLTHEVAHHLTETVLPSHGPVFAHNFVELLALTESRKLANRLAEAFDKDGIIRGAEAANDRAVRYARKVLAEAWGAWAREEYGANSQYAWVTVYTLAGKRYSGDLIDADVDGITVKTYGHGDVTVVRADLAEVAQSGRQYRP